MCGIAGWIGRVPDPRLAASGMLQALRHRGPDSEGIRMWPSAALIHTRLSIIDLSPAGAQPLANETQTIWTVFNGEIYNHRQLRRDLEAKGYRFRGRSDTEILPHLYQQYGPEFVTRLRGMFAVAIYDVAERRLLLARDRFGIKPLFYTPKPDALAFASEINALLTLPGIDTRLDPQAISDFAALAYIPAPETFYAAIRSVEPGEIVEAQVDNLRVHWRARRYYSWSIHMDSGMSVSQAADRAETLIENAVARQLETDVPLGAMLSGGIDSSLTSAAAQKSLGGSLRTFNVQFPGEDYDETWAAKSVATHIASEHQSLPMQETRGNWETITELLTHTGQPFADTSLFAVHAISRLMRRHVTVAISGDGGDEAFSGYDAHWRLGRLSRAQSFPPFALYAASALFEGMARAGLPLRRLAGRLRDIAGADDASIAQTLFGFLDEREHAALLNDCRAVLPPRRLFEKQWEHNFAGRGSALDHLSALVMEVNVRLTLPNDFLFKVDIASMKEGLEVRVPMLDEDLFTFGLSLPHDVKVKGRTGKRPLREVAHRWLPRDVARKPKRGFAVPLRSWFDKDFVRVATDVLLGPTSCLPDFFRPEAYRPLLYGLRDGAVFPQLSDEQVCARMILFLAIQLGTCKRANTAVSKYA